MIEATQAALRFVSGRQRIDLDNDQMLLFCGGAGDRDRRGGRVAGVDRSAQSVTRHPLARHRRHAQPGRARLLQHRPFVWITVTRELPQLLPVFEAALIDL